LFIERTVKGTCLACPAPISAKQDKMKKYVCASGYDENKLPELEVDHFANFKKEMGQEDPQIHSASSSAYTT